MTASMFQWGSIILWFLMIGLTLKFEKTVTKYYGRYWQSP